MEEILEATDCIGDVSVSRGDPIPAAENGGYYWLVTFLRDAESPGYPCQQVWAVPFPNQGSGDKLRTGIRSAHFPSVVCTSMSTGCFQKQHRQACSDTVGFTVGEAFTPSQAPFSSNARILLFSALLLVRPIRMASATLRATCPR